MTKINDEKEQTILIEVNLYRIREFNVPVYGPISDGNVRIRALADAIIKHPPLPTNL